MCSRGKCGKKVDSEKFCNCELFNKRQFLALFLKFPNSLMFLNIQTDLLILKTYYGQFILTTKKLLHIIFKGDLSSIYWDFI